MTENRTTLKRRILKRWPIITVVALILSIGWGVLLYAWETGNVNGLDFLAISIVVGDRDQKEAIGNLQPAVSVANNLTTYSLKSTAAEFAFEKLTSQSSFDEDLFEVQGFGRTDDQVIFTIEGFGDDFGIFTISEESFFYWDSSKAISEAQDSILTNERIPRDYRFANNFLGIAPSGDVLVTDHHGSGLVLLLDGTSFPPKLKFNVLASLWAPTRGTPFSDDLVWFAKQDFNRLFRARLAISNSETGETKELRTKEKFLHSYDLMSSADLALLSTWSKLKRPRLELFRLSDGKRLGRVKHIGDYKVVGHTDFIEGREDGSLVVMHNGHNIVGWDTANDDQTEFQWGIDKYWILDVDLNREWALLNSHDYQPGLLDLKTGTFFVSFDFQVTDRTYVAGIINPDKPQVVLSDPDGTLYFYDFED